MEEDIEKNTKKSIKKRKRLESIKEIEKIIPKKLFYTYIEKENKIGYNTEKNSKRGENILNKIQRNLIQDIFLYWINYDEKDKNKIIRKLNPKVLDDDFRLKVLKDIYSQEINQNEKEKDHNIKIIENAIGIKKLKLCLTFKDAIKFFFNEYYKEEEFLDIIRKLKEESGVEEEIQYKQFLKGLRGCKEYHKEKGGTGAYYEKLKIKLKEFRDIYLLPK